MPAAIRRITVNGCTRTVALVDGRVTLRKADFDALIDAARCEFPDRLAAEAEEWERILAPLGLGRAESG